MFFETPTTRRGLPINTTLFPIASPSGKNVSTKLSLTTATASVSSRSSSRKLVHRRDAGHSGDLRKPSYHLAVEALHVFVLGVAVLGDGELCGQDALNVEARVGHDE